jgi:hypothetical protein
MMQLDDETWDKGEALSKHFQTSVAKVIRQVVAQATLENFPQRWQMASGQRQPPEVRPPEPG